jgi:hypothetical protein
VIATRPAATATPSLETPRFIAPEPLAGADELLAGAVADDLAEAATLETEAAADDALASMLETALIADALDEAAAAVPDASTLDAADAAEEMTEAADENAEPETEAAMPVEDTAEAPEPDGATMTVAVAEPDAEDEPPWLCAPTLNSSDVET